MAIFVSTFDGGLAAQPASRVGSAIKVIKQTSVFIGTERRIIGL
jgi:hypothetical protein